MTKVRDGTTLIPILQLICREAAAQAGHMPVEDGLAWRGEVEQFELECAYILRRYSKVRRIMSGERDRKPRKASSS